MVYSGTPENPTEQSCRDAANMYLANNCNAIIAVGGGSPMDLAKAAALLASHSGELATYALANGGLDRITDACPPVIAIPTTAGTGSEVARTTVIVTASGQKLPIGSPYLIPAQAICDPALTLSLPPRLTAATAFDTIAHCVESFSSSRINLPAEAIALDGLQRAVSFINDAFQDGSDRRARRHLLMAAMEGGLSFPKGLGAIHALAHPLGETGVHHGTVNAILLLHVLRQNSKALGSKMARMGQALGLVSPDTLPDFFTDLTKRTGLPTRLSEIGLDDSILEAIAAKAEIDSCSTTNPPPLTKSQYLDILRAAF